MAKTINNESSLKLGIFKILAAVIATNSFSNPYIFATICRKP